MPMSNQDCETTRSGGVWEGRDAQHTHRAEAGEGASQASQTRNEGVVPESERVLAARRQVSLYVVFGVTLMAVLGVSSVTPAFPRVAKELGVAAQRVGMLITVFTLPGIFLTPVFGILADRVGRKRILLPSLLLFAVAGGACAFARDFNLLLALRFLQGIGAASLGSLNVTLVGDLFSGRERVRAMGYNASVLSIGTASYPAIGGALAALGWYYPFALPFLALPVAALVATRLDAPEPRGGESLERYLKGVWGSLGRRDVIGILASGTLMFVVLYGSYLTYFPFLLARAFNASPGLIGLVMSGMSATTAIMSSLLGRLARRYQLRLLIAAASAGYGVALLLILAVRNFWVLLLPVALFGAAHGIAIPALQTVLADRAPAEHRGVLMSVNGLALRLGQTLGPVLAGAAFASWGTVGAFLVGVVASGAMLVLVLLTVPSGLQGALRS